MAIRGIQIGIDGVLPAGAQMIGFRARRLTSLLAVLAAVPALVDADQIPMGWRFALRALGIPVLDLPAEDVIGAGASVLVPAIPITPLALHVDLNAGCYRIAVVRSERRLAA